MGTIAFNLSCVCVCGEWWMRKWIFRRKLNDPEKVLSSCLCWNLIVFQRVFILMMLLLENSCSTINKWIFFLHFFCDEKGLWVCTVHTLPFFRFLNINNVLLLNDLGVRATKFYYTIHVIAPKAFMTSVFGCCTF